MTATFEPSRENLNSDGENMGLHPEVHKMHLRNQQSPLPSYRLILHSECSTPTYAALACTVLIPGTARHTYPTCRCRHTSATWTVFRAGKQITSSLADGGPVNARVS
jgi:hypothetical protein